MPGASILNPRAPPVLREHADARLHGVILSDLFTSDLFAETGESPGRNPAIKSDVGYWPKSVMGFGNGEQPKSTCQLIPEFV